MVWGDTLWLEVGKNDTLLISTRHTLAWCGMYLLPTFYVWCTRKSVLINSNVASSRLSASSFDPFFSSHPSPF